ncbi:MAG: hypothetical protein ACKOCF_07320 [Gammaproteobacteria bacterium]|nr:hypothetical protein [Gammaproteobacteria bacterium]
MKKLPPRAENLRRALAQEAARVMAEHGIRDFLFAKRKAAERFGVVDGSVLPRNTEIEEALQEYQRLFGGEAHLESLQAQREVALDVMQRLKEFQPRLVGPVLQGTATQHDDVTLHVFADRAESVSFHLMDQGLPFELGERRTRVNAERVVQQPSLHLDVDGQPVEVVIFPIDGIRQAPVSPVDGRPMRRADTAEVATLLAAGY